MRVSKTAMKFLGLAAKVNSFSHKLEGTHIANIVAGGKWAR